MTKTQVEVITSVERRRRFTSAEKERLVAASFEPEAVVTRLAREAGIHPTQLYRWRRDLCGGRGAGPGFAPVRISDEPTVPGLPAPVGVIEIELAAGTRLRIIGAADAGTVSAAIAALLSKRTPS